MRKFAAALALALFPACIRQGSDPASLLGTEVPVGSLHTEFLSALEKAEAGIDLVNSVEIFSNEHLTATLEAGSRAQLTVTESGHFQARIWQPAGQAHGITVRAKLGGLSVRVARLDYDIRNKTFKVETDPAWTQPIANMVNPFLNQFIRPRLPKPFQELSENFSFSNAPSILEDLAPFWNVSREAGNRTANLTATLTFRFPRTFHASMNKGRMVFAQDALVDLSLRSHGTLAAAELDEIRFSSRTTSGVQAQNAAWGQILAPAAAAYVESVMFRRGGAIEMRYNTLVSSSATLTLSYGDGKFRATGNTNQGIGRMVEEETLKFLPALVQLIRANNKLIPGKSLTNLLGLD